MLLVWQLVERVKVLGSDDIASLHVRASDRADAVRCIRLRARWARPAVPGVSVCCSSGRALGVAQGLRAPRAAATCRLPCVSPAPCHSSSLNRCRGDSPGCNVQERCKHECMWLVLGPCLADLQIQSKTNQHTSLALVKSALFFFPFVGQTLHSGLGFFSLWNPP